MAVNHGGTKSIAESRRKERKVNDMENEQRIRLCSSCKWCAVEVNSDWNYISFCLCVQSEKYLGPVSMIEDCEAWEDEMEE